MEIKINGKSLLAVAFLSMGLAYGQFVSIVDHETSGGMYIDKETMDVGSVVFRMDAKNPSTIYGGTWQLITGDASIRLGNGSELSANIIGDSDPVVPLQQHSHSATFTGNALPPHSHGTNATAKTSIANGYERTTGYPEYQSAASVTAASAGTPTGTVTVTSAGTQNATMSVRGSYITLNVWKRIS